MTRHSRHTKELDMDILNTILQLLLGLLGGLPIG